MLRFKTLFEVKHLVILSEDMKTYADQAYEKTLSYLEHEMRLGLKPEDIFRDLLLTRIDVINRKIEHDEYENEHKIKLSITANEQKNIVRFDGGFDVSNMNKITIYFTSPEQIKNFSSKSIKKDFIDRTRHELIHAIDPINNNTTLRKEMKVDQRMDHNNKTKSYKEYISFPWEVNANLSSMAERNIEDMISKGLSYNKILDSIDDWTPKLSHLNYQKELDYFENKNHWKLYKQYMMIIFKNRIKEDVK